MSLGHSAATERQAAAGYEAGARSTTHLFNAMTGVDHRSPGLAVAALLEDDAWVELIADGLHVDPRAVAADPPAEATGPAAARQRRPADRRHRRRARARSAALEVEVRDDRVTLAGTSTLAGCVVGLDTGVRNLVLSGMPLPAAVAAATRTPLALLGVDDRGRIAAGQRADVVELDGGYRVRRVMRAGRWFG